MPGRFTLSPQMRSTPQWWVHAHVRYWLGRHRLATSATCDKNGDTKDLSA